MMETSKKEIGSYFILARDGFEELIGVLQKQSYSVFGPTVRDGAIIYDKLESASDLPVGWGDEQEGGHYRLKKRNDQAYFGYVVGPHSWKKFLHPASIRLWQAKREKNGFQVIEENDSTEKFAFIGVRSCELHAILIQDKIFLKGKFVDPIYKKRREKIFMVAVNCAEPGGTCFCASMETGPKATVGFDLALTEVLTKNEHYFVGTIGTEKGAALLERVPHQSADEKQLKIVDEIISKAASQMGRSMETADVKELLYQNDDHPRWENVAARCLTCANCTMVCPTCFCTTVEDVTDVTGQHAERWRKWDSCFTMDFSYIHGGSVRRSVKSRYRQWMTHKLATWVDQFETSGCVGCGRCITWCPVGIDITEEVRAIREKRIEKEAVKV
ncbi:MAG: 4Fe-4S dicluster domain-containing protein [Candidatus Omnitrophica bacterium]|nr:4Fe-4S dicluster domain-containing protein [Candidatus Omnitrophota bacterium]